MNVSLEPEQTHLQVGEEWIEAILAQDFPRLGQLCRPDVNGHLLTPKRAHPLASAADLVDKLTGWFQEGSALRAEQTRVANVANRLGIFYRLQLAEQGVALVVEQQVYAVLLDGRISHLDLLCSGFHPIEPGAGPGVDQPGSVKPPVPAQAFLAVNVGGGSQATCAILTPSIKRKLSELDSGQVLEVQVDDPSAQADIEAWCRLSGNQLLHMGELEGQALRFLVQKK